MKFRYYNLLFGVLLMASCNQKIEVDEPTTFDVTTDAATYKVGESIKFNIKGGDVHIISFYSGETLKNYSMKEGRIVDVKGAGATMSFQSSMSVKSATAVAPLQTNPLSVMASTDFNGDYSSLAKVKASTWVDITSRFKLGINASPLASGTVDISDLLVPGKPIYFAFKYETKPQATNGLARSWYIQSFALASTAMLDNTIPLTLTDQVSAGFRIVDANKENAPAQASITSTQITLAANVYLYASLPIFDPTNPIYDPKNPIYDPKDRLYQPLAVYKPYVAFDPTSPYNDPASEHWAVSKAISTETVNLGCDWATAIKGINNPNIAEYRYSYAKPGTYKAVFVASNNSIDESKTVVKEINLTITQ